MRASALRGVFAVLVLVVFAAVAAGCGGDAPSPAGQPGTSRAHPSEHGGRLPPPAEPARSPEQTQQPAGRVVPLGPNPEGMAADAQTGLVVVALRDIGKLAFVDGRTGRVVERLDLPGRLRHLQMQNPGGPVLVPVEGADALLRVSLPEAKVITEVPVGNFPHAAAATADGAVAVANEFAGTMSVIKNGKVVRVFGRATTPSGVATVGELAGLVDTRERSITFYDISTLRRIGEIPVGQGPTHVVSGQLGGFFVVDTRGGAILTVVVAPQPRVVARLDLPGRPYGIAYDAGRGWLWVTLTAKNQLVGIDVSGPDLEVVTRIPTIRGPYSVAVNSQTGRVFVASPLVDALQLIDPAQAGGRPRE